MLSMKSAITGVALAAALALTACGTTTGERAVSGGILGAGAGAIVGGGKGAVIGGVAGAVVGAATDPCTLNLGDPYWKERGREEYYERCGHH